MLSLHVGMLYAQTFTNPVLPGGYPDPSICKVGNVFYMANSSFEYYPGIPIHSSKDLVNWTLIGHGLQRETQSNGAVNLIDVQPNGGIYAPTLRYQEGTFYIITTAIYFDEETKKHSGNNIIITATNPAGPWSDPVVVQGAPGIDPDLYFDEEGRLWYTGQHKPNNPEFTDQKEIWMQELDLETFKFIGARHFLWRGACDGVWTEGPHIYKNDGNDAKNAATFTLDEDFAKQLIHGYYACVSFTDAQISKVLDALDELGLSDDTIVVFTSDHGFSLMEHNRWSKHNLFNVENRVPLMIRVPGLTQKSQSQSYVELIDLYPTIAELVGLKTPERVEGTSLVKNLKDPSLISKSVVYSRIWNGDMVVSPNYLYAEWRRNKEGNVYDNMLYDLKVDSLEMNNIADQPKNRKLVDSLSQQIKLKPVQ